MRTKNKRKYIRENMFREKKLDRQTKKINNQTNTQFAKWLIAKYLWQRRRTGWQLRGFDVIQKRYYLRYQVKSLKNLKNKILKKKKLELRKKPVFNFKQSLKKLETINISSIKKREKLFVYSGNQQINCKIRASLNSRISYWVSWSIF